MLLRLTRILLALATALVLTGQVEAAAAHCARLAAGEPPAAAQPMPCHDMAGMAEEVDHHAPPALPSSKDRCECVAVLMACAAIVTPAASSLIEPYAWARPEAAVFASVEPAPALKPPRT